MTLKKTLSTSLSAIILLTLLFIIISKKDVSRYNMSGIERPVPKEIIEEQLNKSTINYTCPFDPNFQLNPFLPKPKFFLIGVAKGGTTSFAEYLPAHPNVKKISPKEPNYWTWRYYSPDRYQDIFKIKKPDQIAGEYTTSYFLHPLVPKRIFSQLPDAKILLLLRNPIDRAYSHYIMSKRAGLETLSFEEIIEKEFEEIKPLRESAHTCFYANDCDAKKCFPNIPLHQHDKERSTFTFEIEADMKEYYYTSYLFRSIYDDSLERWLTVFPREQMLILQSEDLYKDSAGTMNIAAEFLGLPPFNFSGAVALQKTWGGGASNKYQKPHDYTPMRNETRKMLAEFFEPYNQRLYQLLGVDLGWE